MRTIDESDFGLMLRKTREDAKISMGALARHLGFTTPYLSDIERGRRAPLMPGHIITAASLLGTDAEPLLRAAMKCRASIEVLVPPKEKAKQALSALLRCEKDLTEDDWEEIGRIASRRAETCGK